MTFRRIAVVAFALLLGAITWLRSPVPPKDFSQELLVEQLDITPAIKGKAELEGVWHLQSPNSDFGGYSALLIDDDGRMFAGSDGGKVLRFDKPGVEQEVSVPAELGRFSQKGSNLKALSDLESLARDPQTGRIWAGFEGTNTIERVERDFSARKRVQPDLMQDWPSNSGPEAMVRLSDGRLIVLSEGRDAWGGTKHAGLLFAGDPVENDSVLPFNYVPPGKYRPVDAVQIPDGRVLILVRNWTIGLPLKFSVRLLVADPAEIAEGKDWKAKGVAVIDDPAIADNYEGIAVEQNDDGTLAIWLISDDNRTTQQRTLLLKLRWDPQPSFKKARQLRLTGPKEKARE